jgi:malate dehydrogenase (quinone)
MERQKRKMKQMQSSNEEPDVVLIGAGIMSATLAIFLKELDPRANIHIYERLPEVAAESSDGWNNAGTGHSAFCELNYTPQQKDGSIDISKAVKIAESFEVSKQFWAYLLQQQYLCSPSSFINNVPHISFVWGSDNAGFLQKRYEALQQHSLFDGMLFSKEPATLQQWMPLVMEGRTSEAPLAATKMDKGTDVNFGSLTRAMMNYLDNLEGVDVYLGHEVLDLEKQESGLWQVTVRNLANRQKRDVLTKFVFIGAGGGTLPLLDKSGIPEADGYGGFPISGQWLRCTNSQVIEQHAAKVYGKASVGAPPMSVPHLDTRLIDRKKELLFGPFAGFSTKFLKKGSYLDLPKSIEWDNIFPMLSAGWQNLDLTKYLIQQVSLSMADRIEALREYFPLAEATDWELSIAGQRVQVIKKDEEEGGVLEFGTELVTASDGSLAGLLGASPGASTATSIMLELLDKCFPEKMQTPEWQSALKKMIPSYGTQLDDKTQLEKIREWSGKLLELAHY